MKRFLILLPLILFSLGATAQILPRHSGKKISWDDFELRDTAAAQPSQLNLHWSAEKRVTRVGDLPIRHLVYTVAPRKDFSWVRPDGRTPEELSRNQTLFEMAESYANALTDSTLFTHADADEVFRYYYQEYEKAVQAYRESGMASFPYPEEKVWDLSDLDWKLPSKTLFFGAGLTEGFMLGPAKDLIAPSTGFQVFVGRSFGRNAIMLDGGLGRSKNLLRYSNWQGSAKDRSVPHFSAFAKYVRMLPRLGHFQINGFAGIGYSRRGLVDMYSGADDILQGASLSEGISIDFYPFRTLNLRGGARYTECGLQFRVYSDQVWLAKTRAMMPSLNFMLGFNLPTGRIDRPAFKANHSKN